ncbi:hypothetical protein Holit_02436 [Hollandina sp. SP2]
MRHPLFPLDFILKHREFIAAALRAWCEQGEITFTRIRSYQKTTRVIWILNNGEVIRKMVGYAHATTEDALDTVYRVRKALCN